MTLTKHQIFISASIVVIAGITFAVSHSLAQRPAYTTASVSRTSITEGVTASGMVTAAQNISLSFQANGTVAAVPVQVGQVVHHGELLASLNALDAAAAIAQANASVAIAQANYEKVLSGATGAQIDVSKAAVASAQTALDNAKINLDAVRAAQNTAVQNAQTALFNSAITGVPAVTNADAVQPIFTGAYEGTDAATYAISINETGSGAQFQASGPKVFFGAVRNSPVPLGDTGLSIQFAAVPAASDAWTVTIPNTNAPAFISNQNSYSSALKTRDTQISVAEGQVNSAQSALAQAEAALSLQVSAARPEDVAAANAGLASAHAQLALAQSLYSKTAIISPIDGVVSSVVAKIGQTVSPGAPQISVISSGNYQVQLFISENDLAKVAVGDVASVTLDAYGNGELFPASVVAIDPGASVVNGASAYKVTLRFTNEDARIKDGMGANVTITNQTKTNVLTVPATALIKKDADVFVLKRNLDGSFADQKVTVGITSVAGSVEIISGVSEGDQVAYFGK